LNQPENRRLPALFITGSVVLEDGSPPPTGVVIKRVCTGQVVKEAFAAPDGTFAFQVGAANFMILDATDSIEPWDPRGSSPLAGNGGANRLPMRLTGCELRAELAGYRSSVLSLNTAQTAGTMDAGTIVLYPAMKVKGTTVSVTSLAAPKKARKALEQAEKKLAAKDLESAEKYLNAAVGAYPSYAAAWYRLGQVYEMSKRFESARSALAKALAADTNFVGPYIELARMNALEKKWLETAALTGRALMLNPLDYPVGYYLDAVANFNLSRFDVAERSARMLERLDARHRYFDVFLLLANLLHRKRDIAGEAEQLREYLKYAPQSEDTARVRERLNRISG
jgi:tetratricopeptide (TPR) repeat protein